ncbi:MAG TPA: hypothetical protein VJP58_11375 [Candidatus Nitrosocosmicus sp.]|nr:hypothetical protein [Candidatus Nitrosocosmicus sp.]
MTLPMFILLFALIYIPTAITLGVWHRKHQYSVENEALLRQNWMWAWISQYQIRLIKGKTNPKEDEYIIKYLNDILIRTNKSELLGDDDNSKIPKEEKSEDKK